MTRRATTGLLGAVVAVTLLAGCGNGDDTSDASASDHTPRRHHTHAGSGDESTGSPADSPSSVTTTEAADGPAFPDSTAPQEHKNSGDWDLVLTDVRVGSHEGYDRIVLEFEGTGTPGWSVKYVDEAVLDASGKKVRLDGDAVLDVYASGTTYPGDGQTGYAGPQRFSPGDGGDVEEVYVGGTFEGYTQVLAGLDGDPTPFRVFTLTGPPRLVVDVED